ncbi:MAG: DUF4440 domain-containing protein, partial [Candidatus Eremiobacteraeota bacterium]|nr:DUF4440 domain-containing protein [Candidatus Eremiobacteraeota bacterium]
MTFRAALDEHLAALQAKDVARFGATLGDEVLVIDGRGERKRGTEVVLASHADWFAISGWTFDYDEVLIREFQGAALALLTVTYRHQPSDIPVRF